MAGVRISHALATQQAYWTAEQALEWAKRYYRDYGRWPQRRFRVVTRRAGNSRLVTAATANRIAARMSGGVEELIPGRRDYLRSLGITRWSRHWALAEDLPACPVCEAGPSKPCVTPSYRRRAPHVERCKLDDYTRMARDFDACPVCHVNPSEPCVAGKDKRPRAPHARRRRIPDVEQADAAAIAKALSQ